LTLVGVDAQCTSMLHFDFIAVIGSLCSIMMGMDLLVFLFQTYLFKVLNFKQDFMFTLVAI